MKEMTDVKNLLIENEELKARNEFLEKELSETIALLKHEMEKTQKLQDQLSYATRVKMGLKLHNKEVTKERNALIEELNSIKSMSMFEFGNRYCSSESLEADGHAFARALLGGK